jgi:hypothetical protein
MLECGFGSQKIGPGPGHTLRRLDDSPSSRQVPIAEGRADEPRCCLGLFRESRMIEKHFVESLLKAMHICHVSTLVGWKLRHRDTSLD